MNKNTQTLITASVTLTRQCPICCNKFLAKRITKKYCSDACRISAYRASEAKTASPKKTNRLSEKLKKLARSAYGRWLVEQLKRSGTVEVLVGAKAADLKALEELKAACNKANGFGKSNAYEISHIYPVEGKDGVGRLLPSNLVIASRSFNRKRGRASPDDPDESLHILYGDINAQLTGKETSLGVLKKLQRLLGPEFNSWLKSHQIKQTQRDVLAKKLRASNPRIRLPATATLDDLKAIADEVGVHYFENRESADPEEEVALQQLERAGYEAHPLCIVLRHQLDPLLEGLSLAPNLPAAFFPFILDQAMKLLHGEQAATEYESKPLLAYIAEPSNSERIALQADDEDDWVL